MLYNGKSQGISLMNPSTNQIQISASSRGIVDHCFCFICDEYLWDCDHLIDERLTAPKVPAHDGSKLRAFTYDGKSRVLETEFWVTAPHTTGETPLPPPPRVIQYFDVPRHIFTRLQRSETARAQERHWENIIQRRYKMPDGTDGLPFTLDSTIQRSTEHSAFHVRRLCSEIRRRRAADV